MLSVESFEKLFDSDEEDEEDSRDSDSFEDSFDEDSSFEEELFDSLDSLDSFDSLDDDDEWSFSTTGLSIATGTIFKSFGIGNDAPKLTI